MSPRKKPICNSESPFPSFFWLILRSASQDLQEISALGGNTFHPLQESALSPYSILLPLSFPPAFPSSPWWVRLRINLTQKSKTRPKGDRGFPVNSRPDWCIWQVTHKPGLHSKTLVSSWKTIFFLKTRLWATRKLLKTTTSDLIFTGTSSLQNAGTLHTELQSEGSGVCLWVLTSRTTLLFT